MMATNNNENKHCISSFRRYLPQILACSAKNIIIINAGLASSLSTVIISALSGLNPANNPNEHLNLSSTEASWIASISALSMVLGSCMSSFLDVIGRKKAIILCNFPFLFGWLYLYFHSTSIFDIYMILGLFGLTCGCLEAPIFNFIGELAEPKIRGILAITANISMGLGSAIMFALANQMPWRDVNLICTVVSMAGIIFMLFVPETPQWLLSQNRNDEALKSLQWLRGWVHADNVKIEYENLQRYKARTHVCMECVKQNIENAMCDHYPQETFIERLREFFQRKNLIPLCIVICALSNLIFCFTVFSPYLVPIMKFYKSPIDPNTVLAWTGFIGSFTIVLAMVFIRLFGKRIIYLTTLALTILTIYTLGVYGFFFLDRQSDNNYSFQQYYPVYGLIFIQFLYNLCLRILPTLLLSEVFSYRSKSIGSGMSIAIGGIALFASVKTFHSLQEAITLPGQFILYASIGVVGFVIIYLLLPETEGRSLEDIEMYFSDKKRKLFDINIPKLSDESTTNKH